MIINIPESSFFGLQLVVSLCSAWPLLADNTRITFFFLVVKILNQDSITTINDDNTNNSGPELSKMIVIFRSDIAFAWLEAIASIPLHIVQSRYISSLIIFWRVMES